MVKKQQIHKYWNDSSDARELGNPSDLDGYLVMKWGEWKSLNGYK